MTFASYPPQAGFRPQKGQRIFKKFSPPPRPPPRSATRSWLDPVGRGHPGWERGVNPGCIAQPSKDFPKRPAAATRRQPCRAPAERTRCSSPSRWAARSSAQRRRSSTDPVWAGRSQRSRPLFSAVTATSFPCGSTTPAASRADRRKPCVAAPPDLGHKNTMQYRIRLVQSEEGWAVSCPLLPGCHSQGDTRDEAVENIKAAIQEWLQVEAQESGVAKVEEDFVAI